MSKFSKNAPLIAVFTATFLATFAASWHSNKETKKIAPITQNQPQIQQIPVQITPLPGQVPVVPGQLPVQQPTNGTKLPAKVQEKATDKLANVLTDDTIDYLLDKLQQ